MLNAIHIFLTNKITILTSYILINCVLKLVHSMNSNDTENMTLFLIAVFIFYVILAFATYRNIKIAVWLMALCLLLSGIGTFIIGVFLTPLSQYILKPFFLIASLYFIYGGLFLLFPNWKIYKTEYI